MTTASELMRQVEDDALLEAVDSSPLPVAVVDLSDMRIRAVSDTALAVIGHDRSVVGRTVQDIAVDPPTGGFALLRDGRLSGYETTRRFTGSHGERPVRVWVRALANTTPASMALTVLADAEELRAGLHVLDPEGTSRAPVIGTVDRTLTIDRISAEVEALLGVPATDVLHQPLLGFVGERDAASLLVALAETAATGQGACVAVTLERADGGTVDVFLSLAPLAPTPSFAFSLTERAPAPHTEAAAASRVLESISRAVDCTETTRLLAQRSSPVPGLERLTTREMLIVERLMDGDRVPAIAASLFLSQSTVRNHLSSAFRKLRVSSQQELISLLRRRPDPSSSA